MSKQEGAAPDVAAPRCHEEAQPGLRELVILADRLIYWLSEHWLALVNGALALFLAGAFLSPWLRGSGADAAGRLVFRLYGRVCHQRPERSFFLWGYQVAFCQRDVGVYGGLLAGGALFALSGRKLGVSRLRLYFWLFVLPLFVDGGTQLLGVRESNWLLRLSTGGWFGLGTALFALPLMEAGMRSTRRELESRFGAGLCKLARGTACAQGGRSV